MIKYQAQWYYGKYKRIGWYETPGLAVQALLNKVTCFDTDINVKITRGYTEEIFTGFHYELERWLKENYPDQREEITTPSDRTKERVIKLHEEAKKSGWHGQWYRGNPRPDNDPFTDWTVLQDTGAHTVIWTVPKGDHHFIFNDQFVTCTDEEPANIDAEKMSSNFTVPYAWHTSERPKIKFICGDGVMIKDDHKMEVWYD